MQCGLKREITKEQYDRAKENRGYVTKEDAEDIFTEAELCGYGVYSPVVVEEEGGKYYVLYSLGDTCD